jgi:hypothetical protein
MNWACGKQKLAMRNDAPHRQVIDLRRSMWHVQRRLKARSARVLLRGFGSGRSAGSPHYSLPRCCSEGAVSRGREKEQSIRRKANEGARSQKEGQKGPVAIQTCRAPDALNMVVANSKQGSMLWAIIAPEQVLQYLRGGERLLRAVWPSAMIRKRRIVNPRTGSNRSSLLRASVVTGSCIGAR